MQLLRPAISVLVMPPAIVLILFGMSSRSAGGSSSNKINQAIPWERQYKIKPNEKTRLTPNHFNAVSGCGTLDYFTFGYGFLSPGVSRASISYRQGRIVAIERN